MSRAPMPPPRIIDWLRTVPAETTAVELLDELQARVDEEMAAHNAGEHDAGVQDFQPAPNPLEPGQVIVHRAMTAIQRAFKDEFAGDRYAPNVTIVACAPPDGRIAIASTEPSAELMCDALQQGWGAVHHAWRLRLERGSRQ